MNISLNRNNVQILPLDSIREKVPSVFATKPAEHTSPNYKFIPTIEVVSHLQSEGWDIIVANQQKVRQPSKLEGTKHSLSLMRRNEDPKALTIGGLIPTINLVNSHDWSSTFRIVFGMFRLVCSNGLMVGGAEFAAYTLRHDSIMADLNATLSRYQSSVTLMLARAEKWAQIGLDELQTMEIAMEAARMRFDDKASELHARAMLQARRGADVPNNLWNVYNRLQENGIKGGPKANNRKMRSLGNIQAVTDYNTGLFELADNFALKLSS